MFATEKRVKRGFRKVLTDFAAIKSCLNEWVLFLNGNQRELKMRVQELERRVAMLESKLEGRFEKREVTALRTF